MFCDLHKYIFRQVGTYLPTFKLVTYFVLLLNILDKPQTIYKTQILCKLPNNLWKNKYNKSELTEEQGGYGSKHFYSRWHTTLQINKYQFDL